MNEMCSLKQNFAFCITKQIHITHIYTFKCHHLKVEKNLSIDCYATSKLLCYFRWSRLIQMSEQILCPKSFGMYRKRKYKSINVNDQWPILERQPQKKYQRKVSIVGDFILLPSWICAFAFNIWCSDTTTKWRQNSEAILFQTRERVRKNEKEKR